MIDFQKFDGHTPGPWVLQEPEYEGEAFEIHYGTRLTGLPGEDGGYKGICRAVHEEIEIGEGFEPCENACGECHDCRNFAEIEANARLMAAAPELLTATGELRHHLGILVAHLLTTDGLSPILQQRARDAADYLRSLAAEVAANA